MVHTHIALFGALAAIALLGWSRAARAQEAPSAAARSTPVIYDAAFYERYRPQTALDVVNRTPGFILQLAEIELRGFGGNAGNVLIDGQRPTVKSGGIETALARIAASRVVRVELIRGDGLVEAQGQSLVANIVLAATGGGSGNASFEIRRAPGDELTPRIEASYERALGDWDVSGSILTYYEYDPAIGRHDYADADGVPIEASRERFRYGQRGITVTGSGSRSLGGGLFTTNMRLSYERGAYRQTLEPLFGPAQPSVIDGREIVKNGEVGADWTRSLWADWSLKLVGLARTEQRRFRELGNSGGDAEIFAQNNRTTELVSRGTLSREGSAWLRPELGGEVAWNRLDSRLTYVIAGVPIPLPGADTRVTELRAEAFAKANVSLAKPLKLEIGIAHEASRISVAGDLSRSLGYWKPSAALIWDLSDRTQARLGGKRTLGQLDFAGFAASGDLVINRPISGSSELKPEITDAISLTVDHRLGDKGALSLTLDREWIRDALTFVPTIDGGQALLNAGTVASWKVSGNATLPLDRWIRNGQLKISGKTIHARRPDPVTGSRRPDYRAFDEFSIAFRHELPRFRSAYGISANGFSGERNWYVDETIAFRETINITAFVETSLIAGIKATLTASSLLGETETTTRRFFAPDRNGPLAAIERRERRHGAYVNLLLSTQF